MFTIGEFSRLGAISIRMLRHYDEIGLLAPADVDPVTGYRSYSIAQLRDLNRIVALRGLGFSLADVRRLLAGITAAEMRGMLLLRQAELERRLAADRSSLASVEARLRAIEREDDMADDIVVKAAPTQRLLAVARSIPGFGPDNVAPVLNPAYDELLGIVGQMGLDPDRVYLSCYDIAHEDADQRITMFVGTPVPDEVTEAVAPAEILVLPGVEVASCVRQGTTREVWPQIVHDVMTWIEEHGYEHVGPGRDFFLEINDAEPSRQVFEIQAPLRRPTEPVPVVAPQRLRAENAPVPAAGSAV
jgi:DNA-binding transcriptional MerR regulator/effector-binding domain-containing protein